MVHGESFTIPTRGNSDIKNITERVQAIVAGSGITEGIVTVSAVGSTASISTIEYEPALVQDVQDQLEKFIAHDTPTRHGSTWGDDNGFSHIRATFMGPAITVPVSGARPVLGTWQQTIVLDHDNRPRDRRIFVQVIGE
jgi:secondary thiamine-phosphate synthase enzyme